MTKLSRIPRLLLLPALCLAACTADEPATLNADGQALVIEDLRIAGSNTRADAQPIEGSFVQGSRLQATITYNGQSSTGQYTYNNNNVWTSTSPSPAYWLTGGKQSVTLRTPYPDPGPMPPAFNADNWHEYDILEYSGQTTPTTSFTLRHMRAQLCVTLKAGAGLTDDDLARAEVTIKDSSTQLWHHDNGAHYALLDPAPDTYATLPALTITLGNETYTYTPGTDAPAPTAGECLMLTLRVSKAQVSALDATSTGWQELTATGTEDTNVTILHCATPGSLTVPDNLSGRVYVTGTINNTDLSALKGKLASVTHLYIAAESGGTGEGGLTIPTEFAYENTSLQAVAILHATSIREKAFRNCTSLTSIDLPKATSIGKQAFWKCSSLTSIALPAATSIGIQAFCSCDGLESIDLPKATSIGNFAFNYCTGLKSIELPEAETIGDNAFEECSSLKSIALPIAETIGSYAFSACTDLTSIELPKATSVGGWAFWGCISLESIELPEAETIGDNAFYSTNLKSIAVPSTAITGSGVFLDSPTTTLFLTNEGTTEDDAEKKANWGGVTWQTIYYGYQGSGDYLESGSYEGEWTPSN